MDLIVDYLTDHGVMDAALLYEAPFTELSARGPEALFTPSQMDELVATLRQVRGQRTRRLSRRNLPSTAPAAFRCTNVPSPWFGHSRAASRSVTVHRT